METYEPEGRIMVKNWERLKESSSSSVSKLLICIKSMNDAFLIHSTKLAEMIEELEISIIQRATGNLILPKDNFTS